MGPSVSPQRGGTEEIPGSIYRKEREINASTPCRIFLSLSFFLGFIFENNPQPLRGADLLEKKLHIKITDK